MSPLFRLSKFQVHESHIMRCGNDKLTPRQVGALNVQTSLLPFFDPSPLSGSYAPRRRTTANVSKRLMAVIKQYREAEARVAGIEVGGWGEMMQSLDEEDPKGRGTGERRSTGPLDRDRDGEVKDDDEAIKELITKKNENENENGEVEVTKPKRKRKPSAPDGEKKMTRRKRKGTEDSMISEGGTEISLETASTGDAVPSKRGRSCSRASTRGRGRGQGRSRAVSQSQAVDSSDIGTDNVGGLDEA